MKQNKEEEPSEEGKIRTTFLGKLLYIFGAALIGISVVQWLWLFPDKSQLMFGISSGMIFVGFGYMHSWMRAKDKELKNILKQNKEDYAKVTKQMDAIAKFYHERDWGLKK